MLTFSVNNRLQDAFMVYVKRYEELSTEYGAEWANNHIVDTLIDKGYFETRGRNLKGSTSMYSTTREEQNKARNTLRDKPTEDITLTLKIESSNFEYANVYHEMLDQVEVDNIIDDLFYGRAFEYLAIEKGVNIITKLNNSCFNKLDIPGNLNCYIIEALKYLNYEVSEINMSLLVKGIELRLKEENLSQYVIA